MFLPMAEICFITFAEQIANHLRGEILRGRWSETIPGKHKLAEELGANNKTVEDGLRLLEKEGLLLAQGVGRRRKILLPEDVEPPSLRVGLLLYDKEDRQLEYIMELKHQLEGRGYLPFLSKKNLIDLGMDVKRVARHVAQTPADAWVVLAGSREILEWFSLQQTPAFGLLGRLPSVHIAGTGPLKQPAIAAAVRRLTELGHRRIVLLCREERRKPVPGIVERAFLKEMEVQGIATGRFNLPDWDDNPEGLLSCLFSLFQHTPPTALIVSGIDLFAATQQFLLHQGIRVPQEVSIVYTDTPTGFYWCRPTISHISYDSRIWIRNIMRWVNKVAQGENDRSQIGSKANFVEGGTIGPVPKK